jgi:hypothetical protein
MISSLSLAQSPSKPGTATVQNHRFQWLQLPPASSRQDPGPKISCRRAGALAEPGSPSPPPIAGAMGRAGRDRNRQQRPAGQPRKHRSTSARRASPRLRAHALRRSARHHHLQPAPPIQLQPGSRQVPAGDRLLGRAPAPGAGRSLPRRPQAPAPPPPRRRHRPPSPSPAPRRTTAAARAGPAAPPWSASAPGGIPGSPPGRPRRPAAPRRSGAHGRSPCSGAARPAPATAPAKRRCAACLRSVSHLRGSSCHSNACRPCWVMACSPRSQVSEPSAASASPTMRSPSARSRPSAAATTWSRIPGGSHSLGHQPIDHNPGIPGEPPARPVAEPHRVVFAPQEETRPVAARVEV